MWIFPFQSVARFKQPIKHMTFVRCRRLISNKEQIPLKDRNFIGIILTFLSDLRPLSKHLGGNASSMIRAFKLLHKALNNYFRTFVVSPFQGVIYFSNLIMYTSHRGVLWKFGPSKEIPNGRRVR